MAEQLYDVKKTIRYKKPGKNFRKLIEPGDELAKGLSFSHLSDVDIALLVRTGVIAPAKPAVTSTADDKSKETGKK